MRPEPALGERITWGRAKIAGEHLSCGPGRAEPAAQCASLLSLLRQGPGAGPALKGPFDSGDKGAAAGPVPLSARPTGRDPRCGARSRRCPALLPHLSGSGVPKEPPKGRCVRQGAAEHPPAAVPRPVPQPPGPSGRSARSAQSRGRGRRAAEPRPRSHCAFMPLSEGPLSH